MDEEEEENFSQSESPAQDAGSVPALGCALLCGLAFALSLVSWVWLLAPTGECFLDLPCVVYSTATEPILWAIAVMVSGIYGFGILGLLRRREPVGRRRRPPLWAALTGWTLIAMFASGWLMQLALAVLGRMG